MRTLFLLVALAVPASAQDIRILPAPPSASEPVTLDRCVEPLSPESRARHEAEVRAYSDDGPAPAPMPNLCASRAPLAVRLAPGADIASPFARPPVRRFRLDPPRPSPFREPAPDLLGLPPVAPPGERE